MEKTEDQASILERLKQAEAENERLKRKEAAVQSNVLRFFDSKQKKEQERNTAAAFKQMCLKECKKELTDYFLGLNPRHTKVQWDRSGELRETVIAACEKAVRKLMPEYPFRVESWYDNFFLKEGETRDIKLGEGRNEVERPVERDMIQVTFIYNNCQIGSANPDATNAHWEKIDGSCTDNCRILVQFLQREVVTGK
jgi:hypothetical protein